MNKLMSRVQIFREVTPLRWHSAPMPSDESNGGVVYSERELYYDSETDRFGIRQRVYDSRAETGLPRGYSVEPVEFLDRERLTLLHRDEDAGREQWVDRIAASVREDCRQLLRDFGAE
jgi:hypothetical protein